MAKIKKIQSNFTIVPNSWLKDTNISLKAKGLLVVLQSLPDNWELTIEGMMKILPEGKTSLTSAFKEIKDAGYLKINQIKDKDGKFINNVYELFEKPSVENQSTEGTPQYNKDILNKEYNAAQSAADEFELQLESILNESEYSCLNEKTLRQQRNESKPPQKASVSSNPFGESVKKPSVEKFLAAMGKSMNLYASRNLRNSAVAYRRAKKDMETHGVDFDKFIKVAEKKITLQDANPKEGRVEIKRIDDVFNKWDKVLEQLKNNGSWDSADLPEGFYFNEDGELRLEGYDVFGGLPGVRTQFKCRATGKFINVEYEGKKIISIEEL